LLRSSALLAALALAACAGPEAPQRAAAAGARLAPLPASFENTPSCATCLAVALTLRPDGSYLVRERLGASEFYDFGAWRESPGEGTLRLEGGRDLPRSYAVHSADTLRAQAGTQGGDLRRLAEVQSLAGPFRVVGLYDGNEFLECRTGLRFPVAASRAAEALRKELGQRGGETVLVSLDARFEPTRAGEALVVQRTATILNERGCPG
jgi:hypothetical protein